MSAGGRTFLRIPQKFAFYDLLLIGNTLVKYPALYYLIRKFISVLETFKSLKIYIILWTWQNFLELDKA